MTAKLRIVRLSDDPMAGCMYAVLEGGRPVCVLDPSVPPPAGWTAEAPFHLLATHGHFDHIAAADIWRRQFPVSLAIHQADGTCLTDPRLNASGFFGQPLTLQPAEVLLSADDVIELSGQLALELLWSPGHSPGSICCLLRHQQEPVALFSGDTLFRGSIGRSDLPGGSDERLAETLEQIRRAAADWPPDLPVYPGHGPMTTIGHELLHNPWLNQIISQEEDWI